MNTSIRNASIWVVLALIVLGLLVYLKPFATDGASAARAAVSAFGNTLKDVSLLSPEASSTMAAKYGPYVAPELLVQWQKDPAKAPGRRTSSPWPDHIEIISTAPQGTGYIVNGTIIEKTSTGTSGTTPVVILLAQRSGEWLIVAYQEQTSS